jgi:hypothetical protein
MSNLFGLRVRDVVDYRHQIMPSNQVEQSVIEHSLLMYLIELNRDQLIESGEVKLLDFDLRESQLEVVNSHCSVLWHESGVMTVVRHIADIAYLSFKFFNAVDSSDITNGFPDMWQIIAPDSLSYISNTPNDAPLI